ncbi:MAG: hypothetical protein ABI468_08160 [Candidatus Nanopelagicales bacterium]
MTSPDPGLVTSSPSASNAGVLRGVRVAGVECPAEVVAPLTPGAAQAVVAVAEVRSLVLCPFDYLVSPAQKREMPLVLTVGHANFAREVANLARPDEPIGTAPCPAVGFIPRLIFAQTADATFQIRVPTGTCGVPLA